MYRNDKITIKKIAFILPSYLPIKLSGSAVFVKTIAEEFSKKNRVTIITSNTKTAASWYNPFIRNSKLRRNEVINGVTILRLGCMPFLSSILFILNKLYQPNKPNHVKNLLEILSFGPLFRGLNNELKRGNFDIVHISPMPLAFNFQLNSFLKNTNARTIVTPFLHTELKQFDNELLFKLLEKVSIVHAVSRFEKKYISEKINHKRIRHIPLFIKKDRSKRNELNEMIRIIREKYNIDKHKKIILFAGNKGKLKGAIDLLSAINQLYSNDKSYLFIALGNSTLEWSQAKSKIDTKFLLDLNYTEGLEKSAFFEICDLFAMPSISESFGIVYLEALEKNKKILAANISAVKELLGNNAYYVDFGSITQIQSTISKHFSLHKNGDKVNQNTINKYYFNNLKQKYFKIFLE